MNEHCRRTTRSSNDHEDRRSPDAPGCPGSMMARCRGRAVYAWRLAESRSTIRSATSWPSVSGCIVAAVTSAPRRWNKASPRSMPGRDRRHNPSIEARQHQGVRFGEDDVGREQAAPTARQRGHVRRRRHVVRVSPVGRGESRRDGDERPLDRLSVVRLIPSRRRRPRRGRPTPDVRRSSPRPTRRSRRDRGSCRVRRPTTILPPAARWAPPAGRTRWAGASAASASPGRGWS